MDAVMRSDGPASVAVSAEALASATDTLRTLSPFNTLMCLALLLDGEKCVGILQEEMGRSQSHVSQILRVLKRQGLVRVRVDRNMRCYSLADTPAVTVLREVAGLLGLRNPHTGARA